MSWLARSFANSLRLDPDDDPLNDVVPASTSGTPPPPPAPPPQPPSFSSTSNHDRELDDSDAQSEEAQSRGVKEDLSELGETLTRQFWGVASFLAPPPPPFPSRQYSDSPRLDPPDRSDRSGSGGEEETSDSDAGIRSDFAGIAGRFRSGVSEISRMTSNLITVGEEEEDVGERGEDEEELETREDGLEEMVSERNEESEYFNDEYDDDCFDDGDAPAVVGITHEVLAFARNIAMHPETWLDFPLDEEEDPDDFDMSEAQRDHAFAIEQFSPRLAALRFELCPCHMSLGYFWKVYFVLLHSRLNKCDAEILSTPQVMEARAKWMKELHEQTKPDPDYSARSISNFRDDSISLEEDDYCPSENMPFWSFSSEPTMSCVNTDYETEKHPVASIEIPLVDKSVIEEEQVSKTKDMYSLVVSSSKILVPDVEEEDDRWLEDEDLDLQGYETGITMGNEDDISFSDLEDDVDLNVPKKSIAISKDDGASLKKS